MSTVSTASAGLLSPAALIFSTIPFFANTTFTLVPVCLVNSSSMGSDQERLPIGIQIDLASRLRRDSDERHRDGDEGDDGLAHESDLRFCSRNENQSQSSVAGYSRSVLRMQVIRKCNSAHTFAGERED